MILWRRIAVLGVAAPILGTYVMHISTVNQYRHGKKQVYSTSHWSEKFTETQRGDIISKRQPIVSAIRNLVEMKGVEFDSIRNLFADDVTFDDPVMCCVGRSEVFDAFSLLPWIWEGTATHKFDVIYSENELHIFFDRSITFFRAPTLNRKSVIVVELANEDKREVVKSITDEWNERAIVSSDIKPWTGQLFYLLRRFKYKFGSLNFNTQKKIYDAWKDMTDDKLDKTVLKSLEATKPSHVKTSAE